jgi:hypothetical protein
VVSIGKAISAGPANDEETTMSKREDNESGSFNLFTVTVAAIAICGAAVLLVPAHANSDASAPAYAGSAGYFPAEYVNQAREIEPEIYFYN